MIEIKTKLRQSNGEIWIEIPKDIIEEGNLKA